ncbi:MAG: hypothetical protein ACFWTZ_02395 [Burkholderia sp.]|jgi:hypothetical protein
MKCYFTISLYDDSNPSYVDALKVAILTGLKNTSLKFVVIYDGPEQSSLLDFLAVNKIAVIHHKFSFTKYLKNIYYKNVISKNLTKEINYEDIASFLRLFDIPVVESQDDFALYSDVDVLFMRDINISLLPHPKYLCASREFIENRKNYNLGVGLINIKGMREKCNSILKDLSQGTFNLNDLLEQNYLAKYCCNEKDFLSPFLNWKPYWGISKEAVIINFHGMNPLDIGNNKSWLKWEFLSIDDYLENISGIIFYSLKYLETINKDGSFWFANYSSIIKENLLTFINNENLPIEEKDVFSFREVKKRFKADSKYFLNYLKFKSNKKINKLDLYRRYLKSLIFGANKPVNVSVVVASYNYEKFIKTTLDSLITQTLKIPEIIVVDDGSKDNSLEVIKKYAEINNNIRLLRHPNGENRGLAATIQLALKAAHGDWIAFCESDDYWDSDYFRQLCLSINRYSSKLNSIFIGSVEPFGKPDLVRKFKGYTDNSLRYLQQESGNNIFKSMLNANVIPTFSAVCIRKSVLESLDFNPTIPQYLDYWLWRQACKKYNIIFVKKSIVHWRKHGDNLDVKKHVDDINAFLKLNDHVIKGLK